MRHFVQRSATVAGSASSQPGVNSRWSHLPTVSTSCRGNRFATSTRSSPSDQLKRCLNQIVANRLEQFTTGRHIAQQHHRQSRLGNRQHHRGESSAFSVHGNDLAEGSLCLTEPHAKSEI